MAPGAILHRIGRASSEPPGPASHLLARGLELRVIPRSLDTRPDVPLFFLDVVHQSVLELLDLVHPLVLGGGLQFAHLLDQRFGLADFLAMMLPKIF